ncbi:hypothetical protein GCM10008931_45230 [Oceanobacillus oncorhynchi subsp. oncorhynchi]|uniref:hypothetical protein n=1 Tax=Oceanobacillus oncorhynchi TaxID=545501 RepID=UPI0031E188D3
MIEEIRWQDLYGFWKMKTRNIAPELLIPISCNHIQFKYEETNVHIYGYDWIHKNNYESRINHVTKNSSSFLYFGDSLNKGTLQTAKYLVEAKDDNELAAAIWIYCFAKDTLNYLPENLRGSGARCLHGIEAATLSKLSENDMQWHHAMRNLLPETYFDYVFEELEVRGYKAIIELALINAKLINTNYIITLYDSYRD